MSTFLTPNRHGYSVRFSPTNPNLLVVATSQFFGLAGGGTLFFLEQRPGTSGLNLLQTFQWSDGLFDVAWSKQDDNFVVTASGDGSLQLWNLSSTLGFIDPKPKSCYKEHTKEVYSIDWNTFPQNPAILSASWDQTIKLWDPSRRSSLQTYAGHSELVFSAKFSPHRPNTFASVGGDGDLKLWNYLDPRPVGSIKAHNTEVLAIDWSNFDDNILATGGADGLIRIWDIRSINQPMFEFFGCEYAVRRLQFSPFDPTILASVSYDFTTRIWDFNQGPEAMEILEHHSEFTYGLDWNRCRKNQLTDCGWDSLVHVFTPRCLEEMI